MTYLVMLLVIFVALGVFFLFFHLLLGKLVRPIRPEADKLTIYECGEPTIGTAWIQFDLRYYVVALLFVIFDVEVAFFFPWAVVFGKANTLAEEGLKPKDRVAVTQQLLPSTIPPLPAEQADADEVKTKGISAESARRLAWVGFFDILVFFGVLLVGFAYLWKRGDINWIRSTLSEKAPTAGVPPPGGRPQRERVVVEGSH
jgi:NADH-quinone oxidoreductase subunit A